MGYKSLSPQGGRASVVTARLQPEKTTALREAARRRGCTTSAYVRAAVLAALAAEDDVDARLPEVAEAS
jgi:hypothetical protein